MSGDGSSYSSRLSDGYVSNVRAWERTRHRKREREKAEEREEDKCREIRRSSSRTVAAALRPVSPDR